MHKRAIILTVGFATAVALTALAPSTVAWLQDDFVSHTAEGAEGDGPDPHLHPIIFLPIVCRSDEPAIDVSPHSLIFSATEGSSNPSNQIFTIANSGGGTLNWEVSDDALWLFCTPGSGSATVETDTVTVSVNITGLSKGTHNGTITVSDSGATNSPQTVRVELVVIGAGTDPFKIKLARFLPQSWKYPGSPEDYHAALEKWAKKGEAVGISGTLVKRGEIEYHAIDVIRAHNPDALLIAYANPTSIHVGGEGIQEYAHMDQYEDWFLHSDPANPGKENRLYHRNAPGRREQEYLGNSQFQLYLQQQVLAAMGAGLSVYFDEFFAGADSCWANNNRPPPNPATGAAYTNEEWRDDATALLNTVRSGMDQCSYTSDPSTLLLINGHTVDHIDHYYPYLDGGIDESFCGPSRADDKPREQAPWRYSEQAWIDDLDAFILSESQRKYSIMMTGYNTLDQTWKQGLIFSLGSYLLGISGPDSKNYFCFVYGNYNDWPGFKNIDIGVPLNSYYKANNLYQRDFTQGKVVVNVSDVSEVIPLHQEYHLLKKDGYPNDSTIQSLAIDAHSGAILLSVNPYRIP